MSPLRFLPFSLAAALVLTAGCERHDIRVYTAPKDQPPATPPPRAATAAAQPEVPSRVEQARKSGSLVATAPAHWETTAPSDVVVASYAIRSPDGDAGVTATALPNLAGREEMVVNMWRQQVGAAPLSSEEAAKTLSDVEVAGGPGRLFEVSGNSTGKSVKIVTAVRHLTEASWFFKLAGPAPVVDANKAAFLEFVKMAKVTDAEPGAGAGAPAAQAPEPPREFKWTVPAGWQSVAAGQMQVAKFSVPEKDGAKAEVAVSVFPNDTGGVLANVNRWRGQLGLQPVDEAGLASLVAPLSAIPGGVLADLSNENRRMLGGIVPREGSWWFYKLTGDASAVAQAREAFIGFLSSQP